MKKDILYVLVQFFLFALYFIDWDLFDFQFPNWLRYSAIFFLVMGGIIILFGILSLNENLSIFPSPKKNGSLISSGVYGYVRHPIYSGIIISMASYSIYAVSPIKFMIAGVMIVVLYFKSSFEEQKLMESFTGYEKYMNKTGRFFPKRL